MAEDSSHESGSSSRRRDEDDRRHRRHHDSSRRHRDDEGRKHGSHSDKRRDDRHRHKDSERHHRDHHRSSHHHSSDSHHRHHGRHEDEECSDRKRRHREEDSDAEGSRHGSRSHHRRHDRKEADRAHRSRHDQDRLGSEDTDTRQRQPATDFIPTSESLELTSHATTSAAPTATASSTDPPSSLKRDDWMTGGTSISATADPAIDDATYFSSFGRARVRAPRPEKPDPEKLKISSRELNTQLREGKTVDEYDTPANANDPPPFGAPGFQWRMMKLKRTVEAAEQEGRRLEEVALERYASLDDFEHAQAERRFLDGKEGGKGRSTPTLQDVTRRSYLLARGGDEASGSGSDSSRPASRQAFKRPGESSKPATPSATEPSRPPRNVGFETPSSKPATPTAIPSVFTPVVERPPQQGIVIDNGSTDPDRLTLTPDQLNKLQAKILRAELMGDTNLESLRAEYERESARTKAHQSLAGDRGGGFAASSTTGGPAASSAGVLVQDGERELQVLPTLDARGRMYDIGSLSSQPDASDRQNKRKLKGRDPYEARDPTTGSIIRYSADDDTVTLGDLVRQEKFSAGPRPTKNLDAELAANIMTDASFSTHLDDQDDSAHRYAAKRSQSDALKRQFAIHDFARTKKTLDRCRFCYQNEGAAPPKVTVVSSGYRAYLAIPDVEFVTSSAEDHVWVVPMQHHLSLLEADEDTWDEMRNFQKCLTQLASGRGRSVVFYETVVSLRSQLHSMMEAVLLPKGAMDTLPGVFKESLRSVGGEFSTHRKVIDFTPERPFKNALVPNLPYFAVSWDYRWTTGYGHVIENIDKAGNDEDSNAFDVDEMSAGSNGKFDPNFARDIIRGVLEDLDADHYVRSFGKSRRRSDDEKRRIKERFLRDWTKVDWTKMLTSS